MRSARFQMKQLKQFNPILFAIGGVSCLVAVCSVFFFGSLIFVGRNLLQERTAPSETLPLPDQLDEIESQVRALRGWQLDSEIDRTLLAAEELRAHLLTELEETYSPEEARDDARSLAALGLLDADFDLYSFYLDLYSETVLGLYDPGDNAIFVLNNSEDFDVVTRSTYAHEYQHALQDQRYDVEALGFSEGGWEMEPERAAAIQALIEGEATFLEVQWIQANLNRSEIGLLVAESAAGPGDLISNAPLWLKDDFYFPYEKGYAFVERLYADGGWEALNEVYAQPPISTEMILHPEKYIAGDLPLEIPEFELSDALPGGWEEIDRTQLGEWWTLLVLRENIAEDEASEAAAGWGGNSYVTYFNESDLATVMVSHWAWDSAQEADEFLAAFRAYGDNRFGTPHITKGNRICWNAETINCLLFTLDESLWVLAPNHNIRLM